LPIDPALERVAIEQHAQDRQHRGQATGHNDPGEKRRDHRRDDHTAVGPEVGARAPEVGIFPLLFPVTQAHAMNASGSIRDLSDRPPRKSSELNHGDTEARRRFLLIEEQLTEQLIGAFIEVHSQLGAGLLESAYQECLCHELTLRNIGFQREVPLPVIYKGIKLDCGYRLDIVAEEKVSHRDQNG
jgi:hypothetical protein